MGEELIEPICFQAMIKNITSYRLACGELEAKLILTFRPLDESNKEAVSQLSKMQEIEEEVKVVVAR